MPTTPPARRPGTYVALLRGVNVGGNRMVSMAALKAAFEEMGFDSVRTYINSGNVVFRARPAERRALERRIERGLRAALGMPLVVLVRSRADLDALVRSLPRSWRDAGRGWRDNVMFLRHRVDRPELVLGLHPKPGIEELHYRPGALLWSAKLSDLTRTAMLKVIGTPLYQELTVRLVSTVRKLHAILREVDGAAVRAGTAGERPRPSRGRRAH